MALPATVAFRACMRGTLEDVTTLIKAVEDRYSTLWQSWGGNVSITYDADINGVDWTKNKEDWSAFFHSSERDDKVVHYIVHVEPEEYGAEVLRALTRATVFQNKGVSILPHALSVPYTASFRTNRDESKCLCVMYAKLAKETGQEADKSLDS